MWYRSVKAVAVKIFDFDSYFMFRVFRGFGMLWKLKIQFSRTWKILEKGGFQSSFGFLFGKL